MGLAGQIPHPIFIRKVYWEVPSQLGISITHSVTLEISRLGCIQTKNAVYVHLKYMYRPEVE
jgi:hypothetical protein